MSAEWAPPRPDEPAVNPPADRTAAELPQTGSSAPDFTVVKTDLSSISLSELKGKKVVLNIFPSIDTPVCAASVRRFNEEAAKLSGLNVNRIKLKVYTIAGALSAVGGLIVTSRLNSATPVAGEGYELDSIAAVVIGGTSLSGGRGSVWGTVLGALIIGVLNSGLVIMGVDPFWQKVIKG